MIQPIKIHGGKGAFNGKLAKWIISLMPEHTHYVEPFFGGGSVLLHKDPEGVSEVANDLNWELINFWAVLRSKEWFGEFQRCLSVTPMAEPVFEDAGKALQIAKMEENAVSKALAFFTLARQSRQGLQKDYATPTKRTRRGMNEQVSAWLTAVNGLREVRDRLIRVEVLNRPAIDVIRERDHENCVFYCDPPYLASTRCSGGEYRQFEMTEDDHRDLLDCLVRIKGRFLLSGYQSDLYRAYAKRFGLNVSYFDIPNNAASGNSKKMKQEVVWRNFE